LTTPSSVPPVRHGVCSGIDIPMITELGTQTQTIFALFYFSFCRPFMCLWDKLTHSNLCSTNTQNNDVIKFKWKLF
jgi:hypothetical protein